MGIGMTHSQHRIVRIDTWNNLNQYRKNKFVIDESQKCNRAWQHNPNQIKQIGNMCLEVDNFQTTLLSKHFDCVT